MSGDRYEITDLGDDGLEVSHPRIVHRTTHGYLIGAIRQQSSDIAELRAELAAAVAERDQLRARLAAIDNAPTVAWASADLRSVFVDDELAAKCTDVRDLIARPAKE